MNPINMTVFLFARECSLFTNWCAFPWWKWQILKANLTPQNWVI